MGGNTGHLSNKFQVNSFQDCIQSIGVVVFINLQFILPNLMFEKTAIVLIFLYLIVSSK